MYVECYLPFSTKACFTLTNRSIQTVNTLATVFARIVFAIWTQLASAKAKQTKLAEHYLTARDFIMWDTELQHRGCC